MAGRAQPKCSAAPAFRGRNRAAASVAPNALSLARCTVERGGHDDKRRRSRQMLTSLNSSRSMAGNCRSLPGAAARCWWSTPPRFAATRRNTAISKPCGGAIASAASSCSACRPTISAQQEPGSAAEIKQFCETNYQVDFPLTEKYRVIGGDAHPFYRWVAAQLGEAGAPRWNFHKYLIGPDGQTRRRLAVAGRTARRNRRSTAAEIRGMTCHRCHEADRRRMISLSGRGGITFRELAFCRVCR